MLFTDNASIVFLLLKLIKFSSDGLHAGYPSRYLKEPRELSVKIIATDISKTFNK